jgi:hypothetical protein
VHACAGGHLVAKAHVQVGKLVVVPDSDRARPAVRAQEDGRVLGGREGQREAGGPGRASAQLWNDCIQKKNKKNKSE